MRAQTLALLGGSPLRRRPWPRWPVADAQDRDALAVAFETGDWGGFPLPNHCTEQFAAQFAARHDSRHALCVANGTVSLELAIQALGIEPGAEIIVPAYTFEATAAAVLFAGCAPVFADVDAETYCLDPDAAEAALSAKTAAILPVHLAMGIADMDRLGDLAGRHGLALIEDCAHAHGARWSGRAVGALGDAGSFSFQTSKLMSAGEGGAVTTSSDDVFDTLYALANCGRRRPGSPVAPRVVGHNYRMTDLQAAILAGQLRRLDQQHERRAARYAELTRLLEGLPGLEPLRVDPRVTTQAIYQVVLRYDPKAFDDLPRDRFVAALAAEGVPCDGVFYESLPESPLLRPDPARFPAWQRQQDPGDFPVAHCAAYEESVWLPHQLLLAEPEDLTEILEAIEKVRAHAGDLARLEHPEFARRAHSRALRQS